LTHAVLQLRLVRAIVGREQQRGAATKPLLARASEIVEQAAIIIESESDPELLELLSRVREQVASERDT
jgi:hypothetical protein